MQHTNNGPLYCAQTPEPRQLGKSKPEDKSPPPPNRKRCAIATCHFHAGQTPDQDWSNRLLALPLDKFSSLQRGESEVDLRRRIKLLGENIKRVWATYKKTPPEQIAVVISADSHYTIMVAIITQDPEDGRPSVKWEHWDCMKWMGDARAKHLPKNLRETLAPLIHTITDIANDSWRKAPIEEITCEQQSRGALDCATHALTAMTYILKGTKPDPKPCQNTTRVDRKMEYTRYLLQNHCNSTEEYASIHHSQHHTTAVE